MPKREKTPSPGPDEPKFLSIFYPWPPYVTLEDEEESKKCARWIACFVGQDNLYAMFHKPSSPNTIIIEINHELTNEKMRSILGEHDWQKVFPKYDKDEGITHSQVFYSTFRTRREVEKTGWKIRVVTDDWFKGFNPSKGKMINYPYPPTTFCEPPGLAEEVNALQLFRYLPADIFPEARLLRPAVTESVSAPPTAPPPRVVPGSGGRAGAGGGGNVNAAGGKGKKKAADPNVRTTAPVTRSAEASAKAKAKATHSQPVKIMANLYDEDSEGDDGYGNYAMHHQGEEEEEKPKGKPDHEVKDLAEGMQNVQMDDYSEGYPTPQFDPFIRAKQEETTTDVDICPTHKKRCKPGICQWAADKKAAEKRLQKRTGGRSGQNTRRW